MQNIRPNNVIRYNTYTLNNNILLKFDTNLKYENYSCKDYHGIIFYVQSLVSNILYGEFDRYDVVNNYILGTRLLINNCDGFKDIPFKPATFYLLPSGVEAIEI